MSEFVSHGEPLRVTLDVSTISEVAISFALTTVGQNRNESYIMRERCADALAEIGHTQAAEEVRQSMHSVKA